MVQFSPATREARVRFPADAHVLFRWMMGAIVIGHGDFS